MRDWCEEFPPNALLCRKKDYMFAIATSAQSYLNTWIQFCQFDLKIEPGEFYRLWFKVLT